MTMNQQNPERSTHRIKQLRDGLATNLGVNPTRKAVIYKDLIESVSLQDVSYWLQVVFAAGIATLGLVLNSPAVIIGAMLISPLMGGILANGLAFAAGDFILAIRATVNLTVSCLVAVAFAFLLVSILPFKEVTPEIAARTQPTTLDLVIALFSGALGAVSTSKTPKGVATSIPGVAIAVALMPPLCVVGYGLGVAVSLNRSDGIRAASGGGLLFLTNLSAIMFMAMVVFWLLNISTTSVRERVQEWHRNDPESASLEAWLTALPTLHLFKKVGNSRMRFILLLLPLCLLLLPLSNSLGQLQQEITQQQLSNRTIQVGTTLWRQDFAKLPDGNPRSEINRFTVQERDGKLVLQMSLFTSKFYSADEKARYRELMASRLRRAPDSLILQLTEIPTATSEIITRLVNAPEQPIAPPTIAQTQAALMETVETTLSDLTLPPPAQLLRYDVITSTNDRFSLRLVYLSDRDIGRDAQALLTNDLKKRLQIPTATIQIERIALRPGMLTFAPDQVDLESKNQQLLDRVGIILQQQPSLKLQITSRLATLELEELQEKREQSVRQYLSMRWKISRDRLSFTPEKPVNSGEPATLSLRFVVALSINDTPIEKTSNLIAPLTVNRE